MAQALKLTKREAKVVNINRRLELHGEDKIVAVDIDLQIPVSREELATIIRVAEGEPLDFVNAFFTSDNGARCPTLKPLALAEPIKNISLTLYVDEETLVIQGELKKPKIEIAETLRGARLCCQVAYVPDENGDDARLILFMPEDIWVSVKPGPQKELELGEPAKPKKGDGDEARTH